MLLNITLLLPRQVKLSWVTDIYAGVKVRESINCTFGNGLCGWTQRKDDDADWIRQSGSTPSRDTGKGSFFS